MKQIICMKWGTLYDSDYVNKLYGMARHFSTGELRFICLTDDREGIREEVECFPCPELNTRIPPSSAGWRKDVLFRDSEHLFGITGRFIFFDLDVVITGSIDDLFTFSDSSTFVVMENFTERGKNIGNTSCFRLDIGSHSYIYDNIIAEPEAIFGGYANEQTYTSYAIKELVFYPASWCLLFKVHCVPSWPLRFFREPVLPIGAKLVAFPGDPNPKEAARGIWHVRVWHKRSYKYIRPTGWISRIWEECKV